MTFIGIAACSHGESLRGPSTPEASVVLLPPLTAPIPSGWNVPACRAGVTPTETQRLFTAHGNLIFVNGRARMWGWRVWEAGEYSTA